MNMDHCPMGLVGKDEIPTTIYFKQGQKEFMALVTGISYSSSDFGEGWDGSMTIQFRNMGCWEEDEQPPHPLARLEDD